MKILIPDECKDIIRLLNSGGFSAYVVGGCVRDFLLGEKPNDWDITTSAMPDEILNIFRDISRYSVIPTGEKFGTMTLLCKDSGNTYEVTTYRFDSEYLDGRRPEKISFSRRLEDDLSRRDFTINAMAYNDESGLVDINSGLLHLKSKKLQLIGDPYQRLLEDGLRIMRGVRFAYKLHFNIDSVTYDALISGIQNGLLDRISKERIKAELEQIVVCFYYDESLNELFKTLISAIIPNLSLTDDNLRRLASVSNNKAVRLAELLHNVDNLSGVLNSLKFDNSTKCDVCRLIDCYNTTLIADKKWIRKILNKLGERVLDLLVLLKTERPSGFDTLLADVIAFDCYKIADLAVSGNDLLQLGVSGSRIGELLDDCLAKVMDNSLPNERKALIEYLQNKIITE